MDTPIQQKNLLTAYTIITQRLTPLILTEMDIMVRQARLVNRLLLCFVLFCFSCKKGEEAFSLNSSKIDLTKSVVLYQGIPFSGQVYRFYPGTLDTLWVRNYKGGLKDGVWSCLLYTSDAADE